MAMSEILEAAADLIEREGYNPDYYRNPCDGAYCQAGSIAAVLGAQPSNCHCGTNAHQTGLVFEALLELHPQLDRPVAAVEPEFQRERYQSREEVVEHMREVAAQLRPVVQEPELVYA